jgi:hypothetical protein
MNQSATLNMTKAELTFLGVLAIIIFLVLPMWGAEAMLFGSGIALVAYASLFRGRLSRRGWLLSLIPIAVAAALGAAIAVALSRGG